MSMDDIEQFISKNKVDIAMLCVPYEHTPAVADRVARLGVKDCGTFHRWI